MRSLFLILLLANLVFFATRFDVVRDFVADARGNVPRPVQMNAAQLRIIRDTSVRPPVPTNPGPPAAASPSPAN